MSYLYYIILYYIILPLYYIILYYIILRYIILCYSNDRLTQEDVHIQPVNDFSFANMICGNCYI